jgi:D,D-heptose 1,7-bisphosphate phosphatase
MKTSKRTKASRAVILDRDGVINEMVYNPEFGTVDSPFNPKEFKLRTEVAKALKLFKKLGFLIVVVSNQPGIAKGKTSLKLFKKINKKMKDELAKEGAHLDGVYYCLHHPDASQVKIKKYLKNCNCRKPKPGLLLKAAKDLNIDLSKSYMIGDGLIDVQAGKRAGCKTIFLGNLKNYWCEAMEKRKIKPDFVARNLLEAVKIIKKVEK